MDQNKKSRQKYQTLGTWKDEEDSRDKSQDGAVRPDVSDVVEDKSNEHEEQADQREWSGWAYHLWEERELRIKTQNLQQNGRPDKQCGVSGQQP